MEFKKTKKMEIIYPILILIATLFLSVGYAQISGVVLTIDATADAEPPKAVYITNVQYKSNVDADTVNSAINYYTGTMIDTTVALGSNTNSSITYEITMYNNTNKEYVFIKSIVEKEEESLYSNPNITFSLNIEEGKTTIAPKEELTFEITYTYIGTDISNSTLDNKINFRFREKPIINLSNEGETYTIKELVPGSTEEYEFTVTNYSKDETKINGVPLTYKIETEIVGETEEKPITAKIYNENGNEITGAITLEDDGITKTSEKYILKITWEENKLNEQYANKEYTCKVKLTATPQDESYKEYKEEKKFEIEIKTTPFYFNVEVNTMNITMENNEANLILNIDNYISETEYNTVDTKYEISMENNDKFILSIDDEIMENNKVEKILRGGKNTTHNLNILFTGDMKNLDKTETIKLRIVSSEPYEKEISFIITINVSIFTITYNGNGGTNIPENQIKIKGEDIFLSEVIPTREGYLFLGWDESSDSKDASFQPGSTYSSDDDLNLYALWKYVVNEDFSDDITDVNLRFETPTTTVNSTVYQWQILDGQFRTNNEDSDSSMFSGYTTIESTIFFTPDDNSNLSFSYGVESTSWALVTIDISLTGSDGSEVSIINSQGSSVSEKTATQSLTGGITYQLNLSISYPKWYKSTWAYIDNIVIQ